METAFLVLLLAIGASPVVALLVLVGLAHFLGTPTMVAAVSLVCPTLGRRVNVRFATPLDSRRPTDVLACPAFPGAERVGCRKDCLALAETHWEPSPMTPRCALIADGVARRDDAPAEGGSRSGRGV